MSHCTPPTFGCEACIKADFQDYVDQQREAFTKAYKPEPCRICKRLMYVYDTWVQDATKIMAEVVCPNIDTTGQGEFLPCREADYTVDITNFKPPKAAKVPA